MKYENGVHVISNEEYHSSEGISRSALMLFKRSPAHYRYEYLISKEKKAPTESMIIGEAVHTAVLESKEFNNRFAIKNKVDGRTTAGKAYNAEFEALSLGKQILSEEAHLEVAGMQLAVYCDPIANALLHGCKIEQSIYFTHQSTGIQCKVRPDAWLGSIVNDLKTTVDASPRGFQSSAYKYGYFLQAGMIQVALKSLGIDMERFLFVVVEKAAPYVTAVYDLDFEALSYGVNQFNELMEQLARCQDKNEFPGYGVNTLMLPSYAKYDSLLEIE